MTRTFSFDVGRVPQVHPAVLTVHRDQLDDLTPDPCTLYPAWTPCHVCYLAREETPFTDSTATIDSPRVIMHFVLFIKVKPSIDLPLMEGLTLIKRTKCIITRSESIVAVESVKGVSSRAR